MESLMAEVGGGQDVSVNKQNLPSRLTQREVSFYRRYHHF